MRRSTIATSSLQVALYTYYSNIVRELFYMNTNSALVTSPDVKPNVVEFLRLLKEGADKTVAACKYAAEQARIDPHFVDNLHAANPMISPEAIHRIIQVGLGNVCPELTYAYGPGPARLMKLPVAVQKEYASKPVPLLVKTPTGWETLNVDHRNLTLAQAKQAIGPDGLNSDARQRAIYEDEAAKKAMARVTVVAVPYKVQGKELVVTAPCRISFAEIARIIAQAA